MTLMHKHKQKSKKDNKAKVIILYLFRLRHISDNAVSDNEQDEVLGAISELGGDSGHVVDRRGEICRSIQLDSADASFIRGQNS